MGLSLFGSVVLAVLFQIAPLARGLDSRSYVRAAGALQLVQLTPNRLQVFRGHRDRVHALPHKSLISRAPQRLVCVWPGSNRIKPSPLWKAFGAQVIGSTP